MSIVQPITIQPRARRSACLFLLLCLLAFALPCWSASAEQAAPEKLPLQASRILYKAQQHFQIDAFRQCCQILEEYLQVHPDNPHGQIYLLLGNSYFKMNDFKQAQLAYGKGLQLRPEDPVFHLNLALALENDGQWQPAAEHYLRAYRGQQERNPQLLHQAGALLAKTKEYKRAAEILEQLVREHPPARAEWLELLLYVDYELQDYTAAIRVTEQLLTLQPLNTAYWKQLAQLHLNRKQYLKAAAAYEVAYRYQNPSPQDLEQLTELYLYLNLPLRAAETLERIAAGNRSRSDLERLAGLYRRGGLPEKAEQCLTGIIERWPDARAYQLKAEFLYERSAFQQALQLLKTACARFPDHAELHLQRGFSAWQLEDWDQAAKSFAAARRFKRTRAGADAALEIIEVLRSGPSLGPQAAMHSSGYAPGLN